MNKFVLSIVFALIGCQSTANQQPDSESKALDGGYTFVLGESDPDQRLRSLYFDIYYALQAYERNQAKLEDRLFEYDEMFDKTGAIAFSGENAINCDREKCSLVFRSATISSDLPSSTAAKLFHGITLSTANETAVRAVLGNPNSGPSIVCEEIEVTTSCQFDLFRKVETEAISNSDSRSPGPENCSNYDATVQQAQTAQAELVDGGLLPLLESADTRTTVGYLRYMRDEDKVLFVDMYICGPMSHSYFAVGSEFETPDHWIAKPVQPGNSLRGLSIEQSDATLQNSVTIVRSDEDATLLEFDFQVRPIGFDDPNFDEDNAVKTAGSGRVYINMPKRWL